MTFQQKSVEMCIIKSGKSNDFNDIIYSMKNPCFLNRLINIEKQAYRSCPCEFSTV